MRRKGLAAAASLVLVALIGAPTSAAVPGTPCTVFPATNVWNMDISNLPVAARDSMSFSASAWIRRTSSGSSRSSAPMPRARSQACTVASTVISQM